MFKNKLATTIMNKKKMVQGNYDYVDPDGLAIHLPQKRSMLKSFRDKHNIEFDGTDSYLEGTADNMDITDGDFTIAAWVYMKSANFLGAQIAGRRKDSANFWIFSTVEFFGTKIISFNSKVSNVTRDYLLYNGSNWTNDAWNHLVVSNDRSSGMAIYVNGAVSTATGGVSGSGSTTNDISPAGDWPFEVGKHGTSYTPNGIKMADLRYYDAALSAAEVARLYKESFTLGAHAADKYDNLVDWFTFGNKPVIAKDIGGIEAHRVLEKFDSDEVSYTTLAKTDIARGVVQKAAQGRNIIPNGTFDSNITGWTQSNHLSGGSATGWSHSSGKAKTMRSLDRMTLDDFTPTVGNTYKLSYEKTGNSSSAHVTPFLGNVTGTSTTTQNQSVSDMTMRALDTGSFGFQGIIVSGAGTAYMEVDDVVLKEYDTPGLVPKNFASSAFKVDALDTGGML